MNILFPTGSFYPAQTGGPNNTIYWLSKMLNRQGMQPTVITSNAGIAEGKVPLAEWLSTDYGRVIYFPESIHYLPLKLIGATLREMKKADVVHLTALFYPPSWISAAWALWSGKPVVWSPRGELAPHALVFSTWKKRPVLWAIRKFLRKKVFFHATSPQEFLQIRKEMGDEARIIQLPNYFLLPAKVEARCEPYFLFIGRIHPIKAIDRLLEALVLSRLFNSSPFILKIAGDHQNNYGKYLQQMVDRLGLQEKVQFIGHVEGRAKQELIAKAWFSFLPSHTENFGNVVIESLSQGTPVTASRETPWQLLEEKKAGFWIDNTPAAIATIIDRIIMLPEKEYQIMRDNAYQTATDEFDIEKNIHRWISSYQSLLKNE